MWGRSVSPPCVTCICSLGFRYGLTCGSGEVTEIYLYNQNIGPGTLPSELGLLTAITTIAFGLNTLTGTLVTTPVIDRLFS